MSLFRWQAHARLEDGMTEGLIGGGSLQLVTVCLTDEGASEISDVQGTAIAPEPPVLTHLRPGEARELAFCLLELAELAERRGEANDARA